MTLRWRLAEAVLPVAAVLLAAAALWAWAGRGAEPAQTAPATQAVPGTAAGVAPGAWANPLNIPPVLTSADISIEIGESCVPVLPGPCTNMWTYNGTYPGPTIRRPTGETTEVTFTNNLPPAAGEMTVHNHGNHSTPENDGQPHHHLIPAGESLAYTYEHLQDGGDERGATQWYHDHRMDVTGRNVWNGLAGMYIIDDPADPQMLPSGAFDIPLILADRQFDASNQIPYTFSLLGTVGNKHLVNGTHQPYLEVGDRKYRFRILDASNARLYDLALTNGDSFQQIGSDSGLLPAPVYRTQMRISPSERLDVVVDFAGELGQTFYLRDLRTGADLLQFRVMNDVVDNSTVPPVLRPLPELGEPLVTRNFTFSQQFGTWVINGQAFDENVVVAQPVLGTTEKWVFTTSTLDGGALHTVHVHDVDQQCLTRNGLPCPAYEVMKEAWLLAPGDRLEVLVKFTDHTGKFVFHCHFLEHEDMSMMAQFEVVAPPSPTPTPVPTETPPPDPDGDGDGLADSIETACGSDPEDETSLPERVDGAFTGADEDGDTEVDEPLPGAAADTDCDGDGSTGADEDSIFAPTSGRDQDPCGGDGWPANLLDGAGSAHHLDIQDVVSFVSPVRRINTNPGDPGFSVRWDLQPGPGTSIKQINLGDMTSLIAGESGYPRMFGGSRAFGQACPWP